MRSILLLAITVMSPWVTACWSTDGLGLGPYAEAKSGAQCVARGLSGVAAHMAGDGLEYLFCTVPCPPKGAQGCPLAEFIAEYHADELTVACVSEEPVCALVAVDKCPDDMGSFADEIGTLCYFKDEV